MNKGSAHPSRKVEPATIYEPEMLLAFIPPSRKQHRFALAIVLVMSIVFATTIPFVYYPLPKVPSFIPIFETAVFVCDLITASLLFAQFAVSRSRALLVLASGYLFTALIVIPHALTFPDAFAPTGLLGAEPHTAAWLYFVWRLGFALSVIGYVLLKDFDLGTAKYQGSAAAAMRSVIAIVIALVCGLTWVIILQERYLPQFVGTDLMASRVRGIAMVLLGALALVLLWRRQRSVLDLWLIVVMFAFLFEVARIAIGGSNRFSVGFYASRVYSLATATIVLLVLLSETTALYARLARANILLQRERNNKLMNLEAMAASISHEVKQPLAAIATNASAGLRWAGHVPPDLEEVRSAFNEIYIASHRASEIFDNLRALFGSAEQRQEPVDVNEMVLETLRALRGELDNQGVTPRTELTSELPLVMGHRGQLKEVLLNLARNAIEAMGAIKGERRVLRVSTRHSDRDAISVTVEDTGPGIDPEKLDGIFDAFFTTKPKGMGLGLAICRMIVERHGGQLTASSDGKHGALFQFILPVKSAAGPIAASG